MVNVTKENFIQESNDLIKHLPSAAFVAIDEEMTGISLPASGRPRKYESPAERYPSLKQAPERYSIIQLGICLFHTTKEGHWTYRKYNFYMFPSSSFRSNDDEIREVVLNPSAVAFLHQHNMSFDLWSKSGVPYVNKKLATDMIKQYLHTQREQLQKQPTTSAEGQPRSPSIETTLRRGVQLTRSEDVEFFARSMASLREWLDAAHADPLEMLQDAAAAAAVLAGTPNDASNNNPSTVAVAAAIAVRNGVHGVAVAATGNNKNVVVVDRYISDPRHSFLLPPCNSFLRRALYENIEKEYPNLILEPAGADNPNQIRVLRLNAIEMMEREQSLRKQAWMDLLQNKIGMWRVFEALRRVCQGYKLPHQSVLFAQDANDVDFTQNIGLEGEDVMELEFATERKMPLVVHNGFMDILFLLTHFHSNKLPDTLPECKSLISSYFPIIYDTKVIATECATLWSNEQTTLSNLYKSVVCEHKNGQLLGQMQEVVVTIEPEDGEISESAPLTIGTSSGSQEHEAAYDAYMTGAVYIGLCLHIKEIYESRDERASSAISDLDRVGNLTHLLDPTATSCSVSPSVAFSDDIVRSRYGRNKLYQMSIYTLDLEVNNNTAGGDPLKRGMLPETTYLVSGIERAITTHDIIRCVSDKHDGMGRRIHFDIIWIDDTSFMVTVKYRTEDNAFGDVLTAAVNQLNHHGNNENLIFKEQGQIIHKALCDRFKNVKIMTLKEFFEERQNASVMASATLALGKKRSWMSQVLDYFGLEMKQHHGPESNSTDTKRRRIC